MTLIGVHLEMLDAACRVYLLPNAVGKGRLNIFREACEKFSIQCIHPFDVEQVDCIIIEDCLDPHVVIEKILHLDPTNSHLPPLVSTRWLSESIRAQKLVPFEPFVRSLKIESPPVLPISPTSEQKTSKTKSPQEQFIIPRIRSKSDSDYDEEDEEKDKNDQDLVVRLILNTSSLKNIFVLDLGSERNYVCGKNSFVFDFLKIEQM